MIKITTSNKNNQIFFFHEKQKVETEDIENISDLWTLECMLFFLSLFSWDLEEEEEESKFPVYRLSHCGG